MIPFLNYFTGFSGILIISQLVYNKTDFGRKNIIGILSLETITIVILFYRIYSVLSLNDEIARLKKIKETAEVSEAESDRCEAV